MTKKVLVCGNCLSDDVQECTILLDDGTIRKGYYWCGEDECTFPLDQLQEERR